MDLNSYLIWCERASEQYRARLGLAPDAPLSPELMADYMGVRLWGLDNIPEIDPEIRERLTTAFKAQWNLVRIQGEEGIYFLINEAVPLWSSNHSIMKELAHIAIGNKPMRVDISPDSTQTLVSFEKSQDIRADHLANALLLPRAALVDIKFRDLSLRSAARYYGVSKLLLELRLEMFGVNQQYARRNVREIANV